MSDDYTGQIREIKRATSLQDIQAIARQFSARASGEGGVLYSGPIGDVKSEAIAKELASRTGAPIINETPRAQFLGDEKVARAIRDTAQKIFMEQGVDPALAKSSASEFLYGNAKAAARSATSLDGCLWGEASKEFAGSLRGDIKVVASAATPDRVFGQVEIPEVLRNPKVTSLGGEPIPKLQTLYAQGGAEAVLPQVQARFIEAAPKGIFVAPDNTGSVVSKVTLSREAAATLGEDAAKFSTSAELGATGLARAPTGFAAPTAALGEGALTGEAVAASRGGLRPGVAMKGLAVVGTAALAYDFVTTGHQVIQLQSQGNTTGAQSATTHFVGRSAGGVIGGFAAGAGYGLVAGSETGPGALVTGLIGGVAGAYFGEKWAQQKDIDRVFTQTDKEGNEWSRDPADPKGAWMRVAETQQLKAGTTASSDQPDATFGKVRYVAGDTLANALNYKSANASYELGLANAAEPQNPFSIAPGKGEARSQDGEGNWTRNPQTQGWSRTVVDQYIEHGMKITHTDIATPQRAAELDQASKLIVAQNAANAPAAIAARYQVAYNQFGWNQYGDVPAAVKDASARTESLQASDGSTYTRGANGEWNTPGMIYGTNQAGGNVRAELDATYQSQRAGLQDLAAMAAEAKVNPTLPTPATMRGMVAGAYANAGVARTDAQIDAATAAVANTHARDGLDKDGQPYALVLQPDPKIGRAGPGSAVVTMMDDGRDGIFSASRMVPKGITTATEINQAQKPTLDTPSPTTRVDPATSMPSPSGPAAERANLWGQLPPADQAMFARIRTGAPGSVTDEHVLLGMRLAKEDGITDVGKLQGASLIGDRLVVSGNTPGFRAVVNVSEPAPSAQVTVEETLALNQQRAQQPQMDSVQREQDNPSRGGMTA